ncbi:hypothetical protein EBR96_06815, partial [bacterium]|nr:hypothetical protein [bacterium]
MNPKIKTAIIGGLFGSLIFGAPFPAQGALPSRPEDVRNPVDAAYLIAWHIPDPQTRLRMASQVAAAYGSMGELDSAIKISKKLKAANISNSSILVSGEIALRLVESGYLSKAIELVDQIPDPSEKALVVESLTSYLIQKKDIDTAYSLSKQIANPAKRSRLLVEIAGAYAKNNAVNKSIEVTNTLS